MELIEQIRNLNRVVSFANDIINSKVSIDSIVRTLNNEMSLVFLKSSGNNTITIIVNFTKENNINISCIETVNNTDNGINTEHNGVKINCRITTTDVDAPKRVMELFDKYEFVGDKETTEDEWDDYIVL